MPSTILAVQSFLHLSTAGDTPTYRQLSIALDTLVQAHNESTDGIFSEPDADPPARDYERLCQQLRLRFPNLGYYPLAWPKDDFVTGDLTVADAIDDLADIIGDLREIIWRFENLGTNDALWHLKFSFQSHWGLHLRQLNL